MVIATRRRDCHGLLWHVAGRAGRWPSQFPLPKFAPAAGGVSVEKRQKLRRPQEGRKQKTGEGGIAGSSDCIAGERVPTRPGLSSLFGRWRSPSGTVGPALPAGAWSRLVTPM